MESTQSESWSLNTEEIGYYVGKANIKTTASEFKVYIPKLQPSTSMEKEKEIREYISGSCFCNATECRPNINSSVTVANYIIVSPQGNETFKKSYLAPLSKVKIKCIANSVDQLYMSSITDTSVEVKYTSKKG